MRFKPLQLSLSVVPDVHALRERPFTALRSKTLSDPSLPGGARGAFKGPWKGLEG